MTLPAPPAAVELGPRALDELARDGLVQAKELAKIRSVATPEARFGHADRKPRQGHRRLEAFRPCGLRILCTMDEGHPIHYSALERGTPVQSVDGVVVGKVDVVLDNYREHILDGIVIETATRELRFVDAPEVQRTSENVVTLNITAEQAAQLPTPERGAKTFRPRRGGGRLSRFLGGGWKRE